MKISISMCNVDGIDPFGKRVDGSIGVRCAGSSANNAGGNSYTGNSSSLGLDGDCTSSFFVR